MVCVIYISLIFLLFSIVAIVFKRPRTLHLVFVGVAIHGLVAVAKLALLSDPPQTEKTAERN